ncbi:putative transcriptional regulator [Propionicimonas paludicola]|uniref:Putative transcriptional regulator n=2 Tax=Propionicimonas paludicola TaxID=185243 RepID=A0A2A9CU54_9ACTN|nr:putative transcriptional regulator [Propionicimonas paludicola]
MCVMATSGELEQAVMEILWSHSSPLSVREVHEQLAADRTLAYTTVLTVLDRLAKKGNVLRTLDGRAWLYRPARSRVDEVARRVAALMEPLAEAERRTLLALLVSRPIGNAEA